jgi:CBS domain-containing protein
MRINLMVRDIMSTNVLQVSPSDKVMPTVIKMKAKNIGSAIVTDGGNVIGIVTERDLAFKMLPRKLDPDLVTVKEIMVSPVKTVDAGMDITEAADVMIRNNFRRLPVVDGGKLVGIVTEKDIANVEPDIIRILQHLLAASDDTRASDLIGQHYEEKQAKETLAKIKERRQYKEDE